MLANDSRVQGWRLGVLALLVFAAIGVLLSRLWNVQVVNSSSARARSEEQTTVRERIAPARGAICDRNGVMLAENRPSFDIDFYLGDLRRAYAESHKGNVPRLHLRPTKEGKPRSEDDIVEIVRRSIEPIKDTLDFTAPLNEKEIREHFRTDPDLPYHYMRDLDFATVANFEERNAGVSGILHRAKPGAPVHLRRIRGPHPRLCRQARQPERAPGKRRDALRDDRPARDRGDHGRPIAGRAGKQDPAGFLPGLCRGRKLHEDRSRPWAAPFT